MDYKCGDLLDNSLHAIGERVYTYRILEVDISPISMTDRPFHPMYTHHTCPICGDVIHFSCKTINCMGCVSNCGTHRFRQYGFYCSSCWMLYDSVEVGTTTDFPDAVDYNE